MPKWTLSLACGLIFLPAAASAQVAVNLEQFFLPDPHSVSIRAGGDVDVGDIAEGECDYGYIYEKGAAILMYETGGSSTLHVYVEGDGDTMLAILTPDDEWLCDDDGHGDLNPIVSIPNAPDGAYIIFAGAYTQGTYENATLYFSAIEPDGAASSGGRPDLSLEPAYGRVTLAQDFAPDPHTVTLTAGGTLEVAVDDCSYGYVANAPDYNLTFTTSGGTDLYIWVRSDEDTTLLINRPDASWVCDDDSLGDSNPVVSVPRAPAGLYNIWVGTYGDETTSATLYISKKAAVLK